MHKYIDETANVHGDTRCGDGVVSMELLDETCDDGDSNHEYGPCSPSCACAQGFTMTERAEYWDLTTEEQETSAVKPYECLCSQVRSLHVWPRVCLYVHHT